MYWKAQRIHDAVAERRKFSNATRTCAIASLLGRIYLRSLGDVSSSNGQPETVNRAIEQYARSIDSILPTRNRPCGWRALPPEERTRQGEQVCGASSDGPGKRAGGRAIDQLLMDEGKSAEAVTLLEGITRIPFACC